MPSVPPIPPDLRSLLDNELGRCFVSSASEEGSPLSPALWPNFLSRSVSNSLESPADHKTIAAQIVQLGGSSLQSFLQATITGPPLNWDPYTNFFEPTASVRPSTSSIEEFRGQLRSSLNVDGESVYRLLPYVELFIFAKILLNHPLLNEDNQNLRRWRLRVNVWHQRLLSDVSPSLQEVIYRDLEALDHISSAEFLIERASIHTLHGFTAKARADLELAARQNQFQYILTGHLGKRTRFQEKELSQLVVLARSESVSNGSGERDNDTAPQVSELQDDTLLENIAFSKQPTIEANSDAIPAPLATLDPSNQPRLHPLDSIILLIRASSITKTSPQDDLTREETLPYVQRVLQGGSSNWQVYTQALIVRSRIEAYRSRTAERGVLQLQALVDQVIAETIGHDNEHPTTFLPQPNNAKESAPAAERLQYIHQIASPPRWMLEAELADRWVSMGAVRTALEIYERLEMWAEVALCYAASDQEDNARLIIRRQLFHPEGDDHSSSDAFTIEKAQLPNDSPRLFCILGDLENSMPAYERAWEISNHRYARAQRSLAKLYLAQGDLQRADKAYSQSLNVNPHNHAAWFALGCVRLQLETWEEAVDAFTRAVQADHGDAESWSNLAVALLRLAEGLPSDQKTQRTQQSFNSLKRAAVLKRDSPKIWQNLLSVSIRLTPPPYTDIVIAQGRLIDLLGPKEGEGCIDIPIVEALLADVIRNSKDREPKESPETGQDLKTGDEKQARDNIIEAEHGPSRPIGLEKMVLDLIRRITPLITASRRLWLLTAKMHIYLQHPSAALTAYEKAWRSQLNKPGWDFSVSPESKKIWTDVAESTIDLIDAYESLGEKRREEGMGEGEMVAKDWRFKARSAARSVLSRAKESREDDELYERLKERLQDLKNG